MMTAVATKQCKYCLEVIHAEATACKFCTRDQHYLPPKERIERDKKASRLAMIAIPAFVILPVVFSLIVIAFLRGVLAPAPPPKVVAPTEVSQESEVDMSSVMEGETGFSVAPDDLCAPSLRNFERALQMQMKRDEKGYAHMLSAKKIFELKQGTKVRVLPGWTGHVKVRILTGQLKDREVYLDRNDLLHEMPKDI